MKEYKSFYIPIVIRIAAVIIITSAATYFIVEKNLITVGIVLSALVLFISISLMRYLNKINRWISFFILGIKNEDNSLKVPTKTGNKTIDDIFKGMQEINELFKNIKKEAINSEQYFKTIINKSSTALFSVKENGRIININPAAMQLTDLQEYQHINSLRKIDEALPHFINDISFDKKEKSAVFENKYGQKLLFKLSVIKSNGKQIKLIAVSDITKELDNREVDAWVKLARTLSHEIMNNITPITTLSQVISSYFKKGDDVILPEDMNEKIINNTVKGLNVIEERSVALMNFVENYRKFTKLPDPDIKEVNLTETLEHCLHAISTFPNFKSIILEKKMEKNLIVLTDENLISQVFINILKNAYEALKSNIDNPTIRVHIKKSIDNVSVEISNNGDKIPKVLREQIFIPFFTTKEEGTGIGLSLSKQILLKMNADIILKPSKNLFTQFIIILNI